MKSNIKSCISCILPCGAFDVIRIVHTNGRVEEFNKTIRACDIMKAYPKHALRKPSLPSEDGIMPKIALLPPDTELQRGKIYFLMPILLPPEKAQSGSSARRKKKKEHLSNVAKSIAVKKLINYNHYLTEILSEKITTQRDQRRGQVGVWRPRLESILEAASDI
ncbi:hypothetical protein GIB67_032096 [Kingdonia uniflora]|uniref:Uncharacterized protein n=1 Tax=Kingdonia uniflora TaxID=39325 RepID=A0A7J7MWM9_9MAGN|nr:hypothetical protein GIB67_032096 [Kingdonia uniflora]